MVVCTLVVTEQHDAAAAAAAAAAATSAANAAAAVAGAADAAVVSSGGNGAPTRSDVFMVPNFELSLVLAGPGGVALSETALGLPFDVGGVSSTLATAADANLSAAWAALQRAVGDSLLLETQRDAVACSPVHMFGFSSPALVQLLEGLDGTQLCSRSVL
jgi:hypothetical protein